MEKSGAATWYNHKVLFEIRIERNAENWKKLFGELRNCLRQVNILSSYRFILR